MNYEKLLAGGIAGAGSLLLIYQNEIEVGISILTLMLGYFIGQKTSSEK